MKTILYLYHTSGIGGGSYCLLNILKTVNREKYRPVVLLKEHGPLVEELRKLNIEVLFLRELITVPYNTSTFSYRKICNAFKIIRGLSKFKQLLENIKPDLVYVNTMMLYPFLRPAREMGIKTLIHVREHWPEEEHTLQRRIALEHIKKYADHAIAINSFSASMTAKYGIPTTIVYDWIDLSARYENFHMSDALGENAGNKKIYLYLGGLQQIKGTYEVIKTFSKIVNDTNARLLILGIGNTVSLFSGWKGLIKKCLSFLGKRTYSQQVMNSIAADNRIRCIPSRYKINNLISEAYGILSYFTIPHANLALAESIILGTPTIAARTPEALEYSSNGNLASLFEINNIQDFEKHLRDFDKVRPDLMKKFKTGSRTISEMFDPVQNSQKINNLYDNLI